MLRNILTSFVLAAALLASVTASATDPTDSAMTAFRAQHDQVIDMVDKGASTGDIQTLVDDLLDYDALAQTALGGANRYEKKCEPDPGRCDQFKELLSKLIRENYLKRIFAKDRGTVVYIDENVRGKARKVNTLVTFTDNDGITRTVEVEYVMHKVDTTWQVRDIITDGVSLAKNYKYEFNKLYKEGGMDKIISQLESKLDEIAKTDTKPASKPTPKK
jgi:phospholipid transport system substrate-binding protein